MKLTGKRCQCPACGRYFNSDMAFDQHRAGSHRKQTRHCVDPATIGMAVNEAGFWITAAMVVKPAYLAGTSREKRPIGEKCGSGMTGADRASNGRNRVFSDGQ